MPDALVILALETSQRAGGVALRDAAGEVHLEALAEAKRHDDDLMPAIDRIVRRAGLVPADLAAVAFSAGPGGFTGLRIAVSTVKMLALALDARTLAVPSALAVAGASAECAPGRRVLVSLAAKRGTLWATRLVGTAAGWEIEDARLEPSEAIDLAGLDAVIADEHQPEDLREGARRAGIDLLPARYDPASCLREAARRLDQGEADDPHALRPLYPRPPEAVALWRERQGRVQ